MLCRLQLDNELAPRAFPSLGLQCLGRTIAISDVEDGNILSYHSLAVVLSVPMPKCRTCRLGKLPTSVSSRSVTDALVLVRWELYGPAPKLLSRSKTTVFSRLKVALNSPN